METYAYIRVSTVDQNEDRQVLAIRELNIQSRNIYIDKQYGKDFERPRYRALLKRFKTGDLVYVQSIDRFGRDYREIQEQWRILTKERGVDIAVIDMPLLDTRNGKDLMGTFIADTVLAVLAYMAETERHNIRRWQAEGIAAAKLRGVHMGRPTQSAPDNFGEIVYRWERKEIDIQEALAQCQGMSQSSFYRRLREHRLTHKG